MTTKTTSEKCQRNCWLIALAVGLIVAFYLMFSLAWSFFLSLVVGVVVFVVAGKLLAVVFCAPDAAQGSKLGSTNNASPAASPSVAPTATPDAAPVPEATPEPAPEPDPAPAPVPVAEPIAQAPEAAAGAASGDPVVKLSAPLPGQADLAARKGSWRFQGGAAQQSAPASAPEPAEQAKASELAPAKGDAGQPKGLSAPREGGADNLKLIKGIGPKLEKKLNSRGYFHFDQIAGWSGSDIEWADENLIGFKGRIIRDAWVDQAKALATGGETEFAKRAKKDGIYD